MKVGDILKKRNAQNSGYEQAKVNCSFLCKLLIYCVLSKCLRI